MFPLGQLGPSLPGDSERRVRRQRPSQLTLRPGVLPGPQHPGPAMRGGGDARGFTGSPRAAWLAPKGQVTGVQAGASAPATSTCSRRRCPRAVTRRGGAPKCWMARGPPFRGRGRGSGTAHPRPSPGSPSAARVSYAPAAYRLETPAGRGPGGPVASPCLTPHSSVWHHTPRRDCL